MAKEILTKTVEVPESEQNERSRRHNSCTSVSFEGYIFLAVYSDFETPKLAVKKSDWNMLISDAKTPADSNVRTNTQKEIFHSHPCWHCVTT